MLLLADHARDPLRAEVVEDFARVLQQVWQRARRARGHRRRQIHQPPRIDREPAHDFERRIAVLGPNRDQTLEPCSNELAPHQLGKLQHFVVPLLQREGF